MEEKNERYIYLRYIYLLGCRTFKMYPIAGAVADVLAVVGLDELMENDCWLCMWTDR